MSIVTLFSVFTEDVRELHEAVVFQRGLEMFVDALRAFSYQEIQSEKCSTMNQLETYMTSNLVGSVMEKYFENSLTENICSHSISFFQPTFCTLEEETTSEDDQGQYKPVEQEEHVEETKDRQQERHVEELLLLKFAAFCYFCIITQTIQ
ncbi:hypothetical protein GCK72_015327 [Caenorhabditis remanei]|uniref:Uncharacterized protein n=1 Tax=Caenorhabditis remanei TaxID=31234 RepID=A0A6A5GUL0_CAERE|nr:hypothetical protein GCK72_015327 [Caenorhabditis remanei]KAF1758867.1 hypothetical protein GCK72_015327 [Caenorhabditis remanei]